MTDAAGAALAQGALLVAYGGFAVLSLVLAVIDVRTHRLPNRLVLPAYPALVVLFAIVAALEDRWPALGSALAGGAIAFAFYLALRLLQPRGMGGGDVKLAGVIGLVLGFLGWDALLIGMFAGFIAGGLYSLVLVAARRADRRTAIPFGPWMLLGAWIGIALQLVA